MPMLDHFHPPLSQERHWESFHAAWTGALADALNLMLPDNYFAEEQIHAGPSVEIDVASFEEQPSNGPATGGGVTTMPVRVWSPPAPQVTFPAVFADDFTVRVFSSRSGPRLVAAIELVSPRNKDRAEAREAFVTKCASYLHEGVSLIVVDIVTDRHANLHNDLLRLLHVGESVLLPATTRLYACAYRPIRREDRSEIDAWPTALALAAPLPVLPLALTAELSMPVDLESTYMDVCKRRRI
jgi:Protein of unknown function (DUF4058)